MMAKQPQISVTIKRTADGWVIRERGGGIIWSGASLDVLLCHMGEYVLRVAENFDRLTAMMDDGEVQK